MTGDLTPQTSQPVSVREINGDVLLITGTGIKISNETFFINNVSLGDLKVGSRVTAKVQGNTLLSIKTAPLPPAETRNGHGVIKGFNPQKPFLAYEYTWSDKKTGEKKSAMQEFYSFSDAAKNKLTQFKLNDKITVVFSGSGKSATLIDISPDTGRKGSGFRTDPTIDLIKNLTILHEAILDKAEKWAEFCYFNKLTPDQRKEGWSWIEEMSISTSSRIFEKIEEKYHYTGGYL